MLRKNRSRLMPVTGVDDDEKYGNIGYEIIIGVAATDGPNNNGLNAQDVSLINLDDETRPDGRRPK